jgi:hypothetical protein
MIRDPHDIMMMMMMMTTSKDVVVPCNLVDTARHFRIYRPDDGVGMFL